MSPMAISNLLLPRYSAYIHKLKTYGSQENTLVYVNGALRGQFGAKVDILAPRKDSCPQGMSAFDLALYLAPYEDSTFRNRLAH